MKKFLSEFLSGWIILVLAVVLVCVGLLPLEAPEEPPADDDNVIIVNGDIIRTEGLYASEDALWLIPQQWKKEAGVQYLQYDVCRLNSSGEPQFVAQFPGNNLVWNEGDARFYYLSDETTLCSYDPATGNIYSQTLSENYTRVSAAEGNYIFLGQNPDGVLTMVSPGQPKETKLGIDGWILGAYNGCLLSWNNTDHILSCYDYLADELVWNADLSAYFSSYPTLCVSGDTLYLTGGKLPEVYAVPRFTAQFSWQNFPTKRSVSSMIAADGYIVCSSITLARDKVNFFALYPDGSIVDIASWPVEVPFYHGNSKILMEIFDGRLYSAEPMWQELFSYDLLPQLDAGAPENSC